MTNRTKFIILYSGIFLFFAIPYVIHLVKLTAIAAKIALNESNQENRVNELKSILKNDFYARYPEEIFVFEDLYHIQNATSYRDTVVSFFIYSNNIKIKNIDLNYLYCFSKKAASEADKRKAEKKLEIELKKLKKEYGSLVYKLVSKIDRRRFFKHTFQVTCKDYFKNNNSYNFDSLAVEDFKSFLDQYKLNEFQIQKDNAFIEKRISR